MKIRIALIGMTLMGIAHIAHGDVYKCVNSEGKTTYSQTRCADVDPMDLKVHRPTPEEVLANDLRILKEKLDLAAERERRYRLWLSGKYLGGDHTYTSTYRATGPVMPGAYYPPIRVKSTAPRQAEPSRGAATISSGR